MGHEVIGVEANSALLPPSNGVRFIHSTVEKALPKLLKTFHSDLIIVNPPRTGLSKEVLPYLKAKEILYLSCMPSTLAHDLERLSPRYSLDKVQAFDMFPQTTHIETLVKLKMSTISKQKKSQADDSLRFIKYFFLIVEANIALSESKKKVHLSIYFGIV